MGAIALEIKTGTYFELGTAADELRRLVFIDEQGVPEEEVFDALNLQAIHIVAFDADKPAATARVWSNGDVWRIGLVAVAREKRSQHVGESVMRAAIKYIASNGGREIFLTAQQEVCGFYETFGFTPCGEAEVFESGFVLVPMKLCLSP